MARSHTLGTRCDRTSANGIRNENVAPLPNSLTTQSSPPKRCRIWRLIGNPSPVPCGLSVSVLPGLLKALEDLVQVRRRDADAIVRDIDPHISVFAPGTESNQPFALSQNFTAFETRLTMTWIRRSGSTRTGGQIAGEVDLELDVRRSREQARWSPPAPARKSALDCARRSASRSCRPPSSPGRGCR